MATIDLLFFGSLRDALGRDGETVALPHDVATVSDLMAWMAGRGDAETAAFADPLRLRAAVDQRFAGPDAAIVGAREIALFPPVTGG